MPRLTLKPPRKPRRRTVRSPGGQTVATVNKWSNQILPEYLECMKEDGFKDIILGGMDILRNLLLQRIHIEGKATSGARIGKYSPGYARKRIAKGLQVAFMDLFYEGNLAKALVVEEIDNKVTVGFKGDFHGKLSEIHETRQGKEIYFPQKKEIDIVLKYFREQLPGYLRECLQSQF